MSTSDSGGLLTRPNVPARLPPTNDYRGRISQLWQHLRAGRKALAIVAKIRKSGVKCSLATYYNWEAGNTDPPLSALPAIAKALGVQVSDLFPK